MLWALPSLINVSVLLIGLKDVLFAEETAFGGHQRLRADLVDKAYNEVAR